MIDVKIIYKKYFFIKILGLISLIHFDIFIDIETYIGNISGLSSFKDNLRLNFLTSISK